MLTMDAWCPDTFSQKIKSKLSDNSSLIVDYYHEDKRRFDEHLNSSPYKSLKPNPLFSKLLDLREHQLTPLLSESRVRLWHHSRLTNEEVADLERGLAPSSLQFLWLRLEKLVSQQRITSEEADLIFRDSPFQTQSESRANMLWTTIAPLHSDDSGVRPLLQSWGGESAHFNLSDKAVARKLRGIGVPRILEIEAELSDDLNAFSASETVLTAWAKLLGAPTTIHNCDIAITDCINSAKVLRVHTEGQAIYGDIGESYPHHANQLLEDTTAS